MRDRSSVTVVGLGPGTQGGASRAALEAVQSAERTFTAAPAHPAMSLAAAPVPVPAEHRDDPSALAEFLVEAGRPPASPAVFAVPGSPHVLEPAVTRLLRDGRAVVDVIPGTSFLDLMWGRLGLDPFHEEVRLLPVESVTPASLTRGRLVVAGLTPRGTAALGSLGAVDPDTPVTVARHIGLPDESLTTVPLRALADHDGIDGIDDRTSLYVAGERPATGAAPDGSALLSALQAQRRGARLGFGMPSLEAAFDDVETEVQEARREPTPGEAGDVIFAAVQVARLLGVDPDEVLRAAVKRFVTRLDYVEGRCEDLAACSPQRRNALWAEAKRHVG